MSRYGPVDEPTICYVLARTFEQGRNFREAAQFLERTIHFEPQNKSARLAYMLMCVQSFLPDVAMQSIADFRARFPASTLTDEEQNELLRVCMLVMSSCDRFLLFMGKYCPAHTNFLN